MGAELMQHLVTELRQLRVNIVAPPGMEKGVGWARVHKIEDRVQAGTRGSKDT